MPVRMAETGSTPCAGDKRPTDSKAEEKRPPKVRRFDMKTKVPKAHTTDSAFSASSEKKDGVGGSKKSIVITTIVKKSDSSRTVCDTGALTIDRAVEASQMLHSTDKSDVSSHGAHKTQPSGSVPEAMSVNRMLQTSLGLPQTETESSHKEEWSQGSYHKNIVDQLFQEFVSTKMREVDDRLNAALGEDSTKMESEKNPVSDSIEEMSRLLDAEITSIKSRNVVASLAVEDVVWSGFNDSGKTQADHHSMDQTNSMFAVPYVSDRAWDSGSEQSQPPASTLNVVEVCAEAAADVGETPGETDSKETTGLCGGEGAGVLVRKKLEVKKLGLSIRPESLARITGHTNNGRTLEDGEVASSTDSDGEKAFMKAEQAVVAETEDSDEVSGTGSLSDSDRGKDGKAKKKKKKHKHKHKKKKKHKSQSKEKEKEEEEKSSTHSKERRSSKDKKERKEAQEEKSDRKSSKERKEGDDPSKKDSKESKSKDRKKSSRQKSKSPEVFDPWDARNYRMDGSKAKSPSPPKSRHRSRSQDRHADKSKERSRQRSKERHHHKRSSHSGEHSRKRSRSKEKEKGASEGESAKDKDLRVKIDKNKLRKIAIARALANMEKGKGPSVDLTLAKSGGKSVAELTEFCKRISEKETTKESSESEVSEEDKSDTEDSPFHHPFIMRDSSAPIVMNIRNARQLPVLTPQEKQTQAATLRTQFPVSSGTQHRSKESEWVPVTTTSTTATTTAGKATPANTTASSAGMTMTMATVGSATGTMTTVGGGGAQTETPILPVPAPVAAAAAPTVESVFPSVPEDISIGSIILERVQAMRRLQQNPFDLQALNSVHRINEQTNAWAQSRNLPGQFTGTTDIKILTQEELAGPDRRNQAWARKDQFRNAPPVQSGIGMHLLQKMGWKPGDGLGKDNEGNKEPLMLDIKTDRKGLSTTLDHRPMQPMVRPPPPGIRPPLSGNGPGIFPGAVAPFPQRAKDLSGKHPVSALTELCTKRRWGPPAFEVVTETGPAHKRMFLFKVRVNGVEYQPTAACGNKKLAKAQSAAVCLQEMGLIPRDFVVQV